MRQSRREFHATLDVAYLGGTLPEDTREALVSALHRKLPDPVRDLSVTVTATAYARVCIRATVRAGNPIEAIDTLSRAMDEALLDTGLFEEFDVTGKVLRVNPLTNLAGAP